MRQQALILRILCDEALDGTTNLEQISEYIPAQLSLSNSYHGVLAHQDDSLTTEGVADLVHLLRADIVDGDNENGPILIEKALQLLEVSGLGHRLAPHVSLFSEDRIFKGKERFACC